MSQRHIPAAPERMPDPVRRTRRNEAARKLVVVELQTTTPILGGAAATRACDEIDVIRVPTIRGHLRFWWRALQIVEPGATPADLYRAEAALWGRRADEAGGRSAVEIGVEVMQRTTIDSAPVEPNAPDGYALWPARATDGSPTAPRRSAGLRFRLTVSGPAPAERMLRDCIRAWVLFGGYGSRTRRGVGSLTVLGSPQQRRLWLPDDHDSDPGEPEEAAAALHESLQELFARPDLFAPGRSSAPCPSFAGAALLIGELPPRRVAENMRAPQAWTEALGWLRTFRQGEDVGRDRGKTSNRPGQSRWPEADKLRHLSGRYGHKPRYTDKTPAWPRAGFGLPIVGKFQDPRTEPPDFTLVWREAAGKLHDRLASPLIVKALPTMQGYRPCALWLGGPSPQGEVGLAEADATSPTGKRLKPGSQAGFGVLGSLADRTTATALKLPLGRHASLRDAFLDWTAGRRGVMRVVP